jgi:hypothetical protein
MNNTLLYVGIAILALGWLLRLIGGRKEAWLYASFTCFITSTVLITLDILLK